MFSSRHILLFVVLAVLLCAAFVAQLFLGSVSVPAAEVFTILLGKGKDEILSRIILENRLPGAVGALIAGSALALSGLMMQILFRNPVAGPYVLGMSAGANLGVALLLMGSSFFSFSGILSKFFYSEWGIALAAAIGSSAVFLLVLLVAKRITQSVSLLIVGLMLGSAISAVVELLQTFAGKDELKQFVLWTFASFRHLTPQQVWVMAICCGFGFALSIKMMKPLQALQGGENFAQTVGIDTRRAKQTIIIATGILAGTVTAFCGPVAFIGLAVPHLCRMIFKTANTVTLTFACVLLGAVVCGFCNVAASMPGSEYALPVNVITSILGAPFVVYIIIKQPKTV